jgi:predicted RNA polymerase sigma factor
VVSAGTDVEDLLRELTPQVLAALVRRYGDLADAEDAVQDAPLAAATQWPDQGVPGNPRGWLITVAARRLTDIWRADHARRHREEVAAAREPTAAGESSHTDDSLALLFLCCHPVLRQVRRSRSPCARSAA